MQTATETATHTEAQAGLLEAVQLYDSYLADLPAAAVELEGLYAVDADSGFSVEFHVEVYIEQMVGSAVCKAAQADGISFEEMNEWLLAQPQQ